MDEREPVWLLLIWEHVPAAKLTSLAALTVCQACRVSRWWKSSAGRDDRNR
jgi:hypothetical protein